MIRAASDFLVGREGDPDRTVWNLWMRQQVFGRRHDLGHAALVIGAQQRRARRRHNVVPEALAEIGRVRHAQYR